MKLYIMRHGETAWNVEGRLHEAGIASNRESECRGEYVPGSCTHRPSHHGSQ